VLRAGHRGLTAPSDGGPFLPPERRLSPLLSGQAKRRRLAGDPRVGVCGQPAHSVAGGEQGLDRPVQTTAPLRLVFDDA